MIRRNAHKYSISAQCKCIGISRGSYYYEVKTRNAESSLDIAIQTAFEENRSLYGSRKLKEVLATEGIILSRRKISRIMKRRGLESAYPRRRYRNPSKEVNKSPMPNILERRFYGHDRLAAVVSDLTYVRVGTRWQYICILVDLHNREIIGHSTSAHKDAELVHSAFASVEADLTRIQVFHTDRGSEFDNVLIDKLLNTFRIKRSLSLKGCPYDNAVAEATFKLIKTEFINRRIFKSAAQLVLELDDYVHWFNHFRLHSSLGYLSPIDFRRNSLSFLSN